MGSDTHDDEDSRANSEEVTAATKPKKTSLRSISGAIARISGTLYKHEKKREKGAASQDDDDSANRSDSTGLRYSSTLSHSESSAKSQASALSDEELLQLEDIDEQSDRDEQEHASTFGGLGFGTTVSLQFQEFGARFEARLKRRTHALQQKQTQQTSSTEHQPIAVRRLSRKERNSHVWHRGGNHKYVTQSSIELGSSNKQDVQATIPARNATSVRNIHDVKNINYAPKTKHVGYMQLRNAHVLTDRQRDDSMKDVEQSLSSMLLAISTKHNFCNVELVGGDGISVGAPTFLLACHGAVFEDLFYPKDKGDSASNNTDSNSNQKINVPFTTQTAIHAAIHYCATYTLPATFESETTESNIRSIAQVYLLAQLFKMPSLLSQAYRTARLLINKKPILACAAFDECIHLFEKGSSADWWGFPPPDNKGVEGEVSREDSYLHDDLKGYALEYLRESPLKTLLEGGVNLLSPTSIRMIICDELMDVDEFTMFLILNSWVHLAPGTKEKKVEIGKTILPHIRLSFIEQELLKHHVRKCEFVSTKDVDDALEEIELMLANQSPEDLERVVVEGAGNDEINGLYVRVEDDIGLEYEEYMFVKEAQEEEDFSDFGLYLWKGTWYISSCVDYSNIFYSSTERRKSRRQSNKFSRPKPPKSGWKNVSGLKPAPLCTWKPSKDEEHTKPNQMLAPTIDELKEGGRGKANSTCTDHAARRSLTLSMMMNLPVDGDFENEYASLTFEYASMMELRLDKDAHRLAAMEMPLDDDGDADSMLQELRLDKDEHMLAMIDMPLDEDVDVHSVQSSASKSTFGSET